MSLKLVKLVKKGSQKMAKENKVLTFTVNVGIGKESKQPYLFVNSKKGDKMYLVNLVKDNKKYVLSVPKGSKKVDINCTSYVYEHQGQKDRSGAKVTVNRLTLFNVSDVVFSK